MRLLTFTRPAPAAPAAPAVSLPAGTVPAGDITPGRHQYVTGSGRLVDITAADRVGSDGVRITVAGGWTFYRSAGDPVPAVTA